MAMTCPLVSVGKNDPSDADKSFHPFRCCLGRCDPCRKRKFMIPREERQMTKEGPAKEIVYRKYTCQYICYMHGAYKSEKKTVCPKCLELPKNERPEKEPKAVLEEVQMRQPIGVFWKEVQNFINTNTGSTVGI